MFISQTYFCLQFISFYCSGICYCRFSYKTSNYVLKSAIQKMVIMIIVIVGRILASICAVLCIIAFSFSLPESRFEFESEGIFAK